MSVPEPEWVWCIWPFLYCWRWSLSSSRRGNPRWVEGCRIQSPPREYPRIGQSWCQTPPCDRSINTQKARMSSHAKKCLLLHTVLTWNSSFSTRSLRGSGIVQSASPDARPSSRPDRPPYPPPPPSRRSLYLKNKGKWEKEGFEFTIIPPSCGSSFGQIHCLLYIFA